MTARPDHRPNVSYRVIGMDCADDAREIENAVKSVSGVAGAKVSVASHTLTLDLTGQAAGPSLERAVSALGYRLEAITENVPPAHLAPPYRRALWIVVLLNLGFGLAEVVAGFLARSQALKSDALDFIGDGLITMLGIVALRWAAQARARAALLQGMFLGALGLAVMGTTLYRVVVQQMPEAELMGWTAALALLVNVGAAAVLIPHRTGDVHVRAIWLFSRNDAIGNAAVIVAALLVAWSGTPWPDLVVAGVVGSLFLHSAISIVRDALADASATT